MPLPISYPELHISPVRTLNLQRESYHQYTGSFVVDKMASSDRVVVDLDQLLDGDGTVAVAMQLWSSRNGPAMYNQWQSLYFQLIKVGFEDEESAEGESAKERQARISRMYKVIQEEVHGPDYMARAVIESNKQRAKAARKAGSRGGKALSSEQVQMLRDGRIGDGALARQAVGGGTADGLLSQCTRGDPAAAAECGCNVPTWHAMDTPRGEELAEPSAAEGIDLLWSDEQAQLGVRDNEATHTELREDGRPHG